MKTKKMFMVLFAGVICTLVVIFGVRYLPIPGLKKAEQAIEEKLELQDQQTENNENLPQGVIPVTSVAMVNQIEKSSAPMVIKFYSDWCGHCVAAKKALPGLAQELDGKVDFYAINVSNKEVVDAAENKGLTKGAIEAIPAFIYREKDKTHEITEGFADARRLREEIKKRLGV